MSMFDQMLSKLGMHDESYDDEFEIEDGDELEDEPRKSFFGRRKQYEDEDDVDDRVETSFDKPYTNRYTQNNTTAYKAKSKMQSANSRSNSSSKLVPLATTSKGQVIFIIKPLGTSECRQVIDYLKDGKVVILNLSENEVSVGQQIIDIITGCIYSINGSLNFVSDMMFIAAPEGVEIDGDVLKATDMYENNMFNLDSQFSYDE